MISKFLPAAGSPPNTNAISLPVSELGSVAVQILGTWAGTITFYVSIDGQTFSPILMTPAGSSTAVSSTTANGEWSAGVGGYAVFAVAFSSYGSGQALVNVQGSPGGGGGAGGSGGGGGGAVTIADGADAALGATTDAAASTDTGTFSLIALFKRSLQRFTTLIANLGSPYQAGGALPLPSGASTAAKQPALGTAGTAAADVLSVQGITSMTPLKVDGSGVTQPVSGPLTDAQLRATPVPISGTVTATTGGLTDTQLRASAVPVSAASLPLPSGAATEATLSGVLTTSDFDTKTGSLTETAPATDTASSGLNGRLQRIAQRITSLITALGSPFQAGGSIGNTTFASTQSGTWTVQPGNTANTTAWKVDGSAVTQPISGPVTVASGGIASGALASGSVASGAIASGAVASGAFASGSIASGAVASGAVASGAFVSGSVSDGAVVTLGAKTDAKSTATDATSITIMQVLKQISASVQLWVFGTGTAAASARVNVASDDAQFGGVTETAPATDTASSGLNGRLQRVSQRLTTLITNMALVFGAGTAAAAQRVTLASDDPAVATLGATTGAKVITDANGTLQQYLRGLVYQLITAGASFFTPVPDTVNGWLVAMMTSGDGSTALTSTAQAIKASAGKLGGWYIYNPNAVATYVVIYNVAAASVTVGTTNGQIVLCIPATQAANIEFAMGIPFTNAGWSVAATTTGGGAGSPTTALEANFFYK